MEELGSFFLGVGFIVAFLCNFACFKHIKETYDVSQSLYYVLALDAIFASIVSAIEAPILWYKSFGFKTGEFLCSIFLYAPYLPAIQACLFGIISIVRYENHSQPLYDCSRFFLF